MVTGGGSNGFTDAVGNTSPSNRGCSAPSSDYPPPSAEAPVRRSSENRRSNKPIMEKRRRARINNCLNELKSLILDAMKKDPARHSKLEKADILEMTVRHLQTLQRQQVAMAVAADPNVINKYRAGFSECASEVGRFLGRVDGLDGSVKRRLLSHLSNCISGANTAPIAAPHPPPPAPQSQQPVQQQLTQLQVQVPVMSSNPGTVVNVPHSFDGFQLVPTRLPNGDIAFILPSSSSQVLQPQQQPTASAAPTVHVRQPNIHPQQQQHRMSPSASSSSSSASPVFFDRCFPLSVNTTPQSRDFASPHSATPTSLSPVCSDVSEPHRSLSPSMQKPLSLVIRRPSCIDSPPALSDKPWRPW